LASVSASRQSASDANSAAHLLHRILLFGCQFVCDHVEAQQ
jgi:hypothetical protein